MALFPGANFYSEMVAQASREASKTAQHENSARPATQFFTQQTVGVGQFRLAQPLMFDIPFLEEPVFVQGAGVGKGLNPNDWHDPVGICGLRAWVRDDRNHFLGAYLYFKVTLEPLRDDLIVTQYPDVTMVHHLMFFGLSYKPLPQNARAEIENVIPRPVNLTGI